MTDLLACATCMGAPGHQTTVAAGQAIVVMLWVLAGMAFLVGGFVARLVVRARRHAREHGIPGESEPAPRGFPPRPAPPIGPASLSARPS